MEKKGVLLHFNQSGSGPIAWCFQDEAHIDGDYFAPEGRHELVFGDQLTIIEKNEPEKVLWEGVINSDDVQKHILTNMLDRKLWLHWFDQRYLAILVKK